jgi:hypothetical protein
VEELDAKEEGVQLPGLRGPDGDYFSLWRAEAAVAKVSKSQPACFGRLLSKGIFFGAVFSNDS